MKDNTGKSKEYLQKALTNLPTDFALQEVRYHLRAALGKIEHVEKRRAAAQQQPQKLTRAEAWNEQLKDNMKNPLTIESTLDAINQMIDAEKAKLESYKNQQKPQKPSMRPMPQDEDGDYGIIHD